MNKKKPNALDTTWTKHGHVSILSQPQAENPMVKTKRLSRSSSLPAQTLGWWVHVTRTQRLSNLQLGVKGHFESPGKCVVLFLLLKFALETHEMNIHVSILVSLVLSNASYGVAVSIPFGSNLGLLQTQMLWNLLSSWLFVNISLRKQWKQKPGDTSHWIGWIETFKIPWYNLYLYVIYISCIMA